MLRNAKGDQRTGIHKDMQTYIHKFVEVTSNQQSTHTRTHKNTHTHIHSTHAHTLNTQKHIHTHTHINTHTQSIHYLATLSANNAARPNAHHLGGAVLEEGGGQLLGQGGFRVGVGLQ